MALLISAFPDVTPSDRETALKQSAFELGSIGPDSTYGYGLIDIVAAYNFIRDLLVTSRLLLKLLATQTLEALPLLKPSR